MNYTEALDYIHGTERFNTEPGLSRIADMLSYMGNPQKKPRYVHVAGTNGKGSTSAMLAGVLADAGCKTGLYTSPYLEEFTERIQINREEIPAKKLVELTEKTKALIERMQAEGHVPPTQFEIITAMALGYFADEGCDVVVLEVGMGGRFDATNVIDAPDVAVIGSISLDHTQHLGSTLAEIAFEKCGIIKTGSTVVCYPDQAPEALEVISAACRERGCRLVIPDLSSLLVLESGRAGSRVRFDGEEYRTPLVGEHQILNMLTAIAAARELGTRGVPIETENIRRGIAGALWKGRLETICEHPLILIDAAHNADAVDKLVLELDRSYSDCRILSVMGMLSDKDFEHCITEVAKRSARFVATAPMNPRALPPETTAACARKVCGDVHVVPAIDDAIDFALSAYREGDLILASGSIFLIGEARTYVRRLFPEHSPGISNE